MNTQEALSKISQAIASGSIGDAERVLEEFSKERQSQKSDPSELCMLKLKGKSITLVMPNGEFIPGIKKDSLKVVIDADLLRCGLVRVDISLLIKSKDLPQL